VTGDPGSPERIVAGRPFTIEYDSNQVAVQDTVGPPGTTFSSNDATGGLIAPTVPAAGPAVFTVRYTDIAATAATACTQSASFTVDVGPGDLLAPRIGYSEGPTIKLIGKFARLPRRGDLTGGAPVAGLLFPCTDTTAKVPLLAELRVERNLRRRPSAASPLTTLALPDPCGPKPSAAAAPGARLRHANIFEQQLDGGGGAPLRGRRPLLAAHHPGRPPARRAALLRRLPPRGHAILGRLGDRPGRGLRARPLRASAAGRPDDPSRLPQVPDPALRPVDDVAKRTPRPWVRRRQSG
jgi:hypothetical protein